MKELKHFVKEKPSENWLKELESYDDVEVMLRCALASIELSFRELKGSTILIYSPPIIEVVKQYIIHPSIENAQRAYEFIPIVKKLASLAEEKSTEQGDWWSDEAVEVVGYMLVAIAQHHELMPYSREYPDKPSNLIEYTAGHFIVFPSNITRDKIKLYIQINQRVIRPWVLEKKETFFMYRTWNSLKEQYLS